MVAKWIQKLPLKKRWLLNQGGRTIIDDLELDNIGQYVWMWDGYKREPVKVYLPSEEKLKELYLQKKSCKVG